MPEVHEAGYRMVPTDPVTIDPRSPIAELRGLFLYYFSNNSFSLIG